MKIDNLRELILKKKADQLNNQLENKKDNENDLGNSANINQTDPNDTSKKKYNQMRLLLIKKKLGKSESEEGKNKVIQDFLNKYSIEILQEEPLILKGKNIEACLEMASLILNASKEYIEYKINYEKKLGFFGLGGVEYQILFKLAANDIEDDLGSESNKMPDFAELEQTISEDKRKEKKEKELKDVFKEEENRKIKLGIRNFKSKPFILKTLSDGLFLYLNDAQQDGLNLNNIVKVLQLSKISNYSTKIIQKMIANQQYNEWIKIADDFSDNVVDREATKINIEIAEDKMRCFLTVSSPKNLGRIITVGQILVELEKLGVSYGVNQSRIEEIIEYQIFNVKFCIAEGKEARAASFINLSLRFNNNKKALFLNEDNFNRVDFFGDHHIVQNVLAEQVIADVIPSKEGEIGKNIFGEEIPIPEKEDLKIVLGDSVKYSLDKTQIIAKISGRPIFDNGKIDVKSSYKVNGNVGLETGSINFLGDIFVKGNVEDGFSLNASGNIYVKGIVGRCNIQAEGDIIIQGGIIGKGSNFIKSDKNIFAKFVEKSNIHCGGHLIIPEGSLHSIINAKSVISLGKRGAVVGGHICAFEEVNVKVIGSSNFSEIKVEVGLNPLLRQELTVLQISFKTFKEELKKVDLNIHAMQAQVEKLRLNKQSIDKKKRILYNKLNMSKIDLEIKLTEIKDRIADIKQQLENLGEKGQISVLENVYPGTELLIRNSGIKITETYTNKTFVLDSNTMDIKTISYQEFSNQEILGLGNIKF